MTTRLEKPIRRELTAGDMDLRYEIQPGTLVIIEISRGGLSFRQKGRRFTITLPWRDAYRFAERLAGERLRLERLSQRARRR